MKVSFNWLKEYINSEVNLNDMVEILTNTGLEVASVEKFEQYKGGLKGLVIGEILEVSKHPNADRLSLTKVDTGNGSSLSIVCGAPNVKEGQKVVVAPVGSKLYHINGESFAIKKGKIRGEVSEGMICAEDEIGIGHDHDGIMVLGKKAKVGESVRNYFSVQDDFTIDIDLTPNRTDAISHLGVARDYLAVKNLELGELQQKVEIPDVSKFEVENQELIIDVRIEDRAACPRYTAVTMTNVKVEESPVWLQLKLKAIGLKPINNIVDVANFVMYETGQPLHVFDADKITTGKVVVGKLTNGTVFKTLDGTDRKLSKDDLMINNNTDPMCMAGVFGGFSSGVTEKTQNIFIESAYFSPSGIRKTARYHGLSTDASYRYERGANPDGTIYTLKRVALMIKKVAGGLVSSDIIDEYPFKIEATELNIRFSYLNKISGKLIPKDEVRSILNSLDFDLMMELGDVLKLRVPGYRTDVRREIDVVEEILRIYGFNKIEIPTLMQSSISTRPKDGNAFKLKSANYLSSVGFKEIINNSLTAASFYKNSKHLISIKNPLSNELDVLRESLVFGGLQSIQYNINRNSKDLKFFEFGKVYSKSGKKFDESFRLVLWLTGNENSESWREKQRKLDFYDAKNYLETLMLKLGINFDSLSFDEFQSKRSDFGLSYLYGKDELVSLYKVDKNLCDSFEIDQDVFVADIRWDLVIEKLFKEKIIFKPLPKYPSMRRDLALLIDQDVQYDVIERIAKKTEKSILRKVNLFDVYKGKGMDPKKKSYAVSFVFRDDDKTLTDKHIDKIMDRMIDNFKKELGAELR